MGSLCIAHLGNIGHLLTPEQEKVLQRVDVMMIPIDAMTNLGFEDILKVIAQVKPPIVIPMHYDVVNQGELFAAFAREHLSHTQNRRLAAHIESHRTAEVHRSLRAQTPA